MGRKYRVRVATSDGLEQIIIMGAGAVRISAREFEKEVMDTCRELRDAYLERTAGQPGFRNRLLEGASQEVEQYLEKMAAPEITEEKDR